MLDTTSAMTTQKWERVHKRLRAQLGEDVHASWFARMKLESLDEGQVVLSVPTRFLKTWIETHYAETLRQVVREEFPNTGGLILRVRSAMRAPRAPARHEEEARATSKERDAASAGQRGMGAPLDAALTFETFVVGMSNALAQAAARQVAEQADSGATSLNPLFIHAATGLGKTHLLQAIAWRIMERQPSRRILYLSAEQFMFHFLSALKAREVLDFKERFQAVDVLLVDDFQFLQGRTMQQEFCQVFNWLMDSRRQIVVAADAGPAELEKIDARMRSRLLGGLVVDMQTPDENMRREILKRKLAALREREPDLHVQPEVIDYIAATIHGGGRELDGALNRIIALMQLAGARVDRDMAAQALRDLAGRGRSRPVRIDDILKAVSQLYHVSRGDLLSARRARSIVRPRQIGMYLAKKLTSRSLPEIGRRFGGRDHSTVLHAVRKIEQLLGSDEQLQQEIETLTQMISEA